ncbi:MAG: carboxypeptidase regulatory-like domain-containing protein [Acidobacteria bacterium]|nr:carboxypeptidase regulatory-like domain-containing protein [Acidobacteriota bacterium]
MTYARPRLVVSLIVFVVLLLAFSAANYFANDLSLRLNEKACRLSFEETKTKASLALENTSGRIIAANFKLELRDPQNRVRYRIERDEPIKSGNVTLNFDLAPVENNALLGANDQLWLRLHYVITPLKIAEADAALPTIDGVISASEITPDIFELQVFSPNQANAGSRYQTRVRTAHPITGKPIRDVKISAEATIEIDDTEQKLKASGSTDENGYAVINFALPKDLGESNGSLEIEFTAKRGSLEQTADANIVLTQTDHYIVTTDKPIYQPGQTIHTRVLLFDSNRQAISNHELDAVIEDKEEQKFYRTKMTTSNFGVASFDWKIPDNTRLGNYRIIVGKQSATRIWGQAEVKISRYDLPTFIVNAKPDRAYYLPGQDAEITVKADYLFGQPVTKGKVKVVRESERTWNYRKQKYDTEEGEKLEGETDDTGKFTAKIPLKEHHDDFESSDYHKFEDLHFAAYFTDTTTGRTEQRRFDIRLTKDPIHLYLVSEERQVENSPLEFYVTASYADGTPAQCDIALRQQFANDEQTLVRTIKTNRYGVAKASNLHLPNADNDAELVLEARDAEGKIGKLQKTISRDAEPVIRVSTDKALYRAGENIQATIKSNIPNTRLVLEVLQDNRILQSQMLELKDGQASIALPYKSEYKDEITIAAYANVMVDENDDEFVYNARTVLFPRDRELKLDVKLPRTDYQPGEEVTAGINVRTPDGRAALSAIGAVIVDTAVEERARTDSEFGSGYRSYFNYFYGNENVSGITRRDLDKLDLKQAISPEIDLVAEILLRDYGSHISNHTNSNYRKDQRSLFSGVINAQLYLLQSALESAYNAKAIYPKDIAALKRILRSHNLNPEALLDPWNTPYRFSFLTERDLDQMTILCAGADKQFHTNDDFIALSLARPYFKFTGEAINRVVANYQTRTGGYINDAATLKTELRRAGIDFDSLHDPWDMPYQVTFRKDWNGYQMVIASAGRNRRFEEPSPLGIDDVQVWRTPIEFSSEMYWQIYSALENYFNATKKFPGDEVSLRAVLQNAGVDFDKFADPWGHKYQIFFTQDSRYSNRVEIVDVAKPGEKPQQRTEVIPVTQTVITIHLRSAGENGQVGDLDDFHVTTFSRVIAEQTSQTKTPEKKADVVLHETRVSGNIKPASAASFGAAGAIAGVITDSSGAIIPNVFIKATLRDTTSFYSTRSNNEGVFLLKNLPLGLYDVEVESPGFKKLRQVDVKVLASKIVQLNMTLEVGAVTEAVMITADTVALQTTSASVASTVSPQQIMNLPLNGRNAMQLLAVQPGVMKQGDISTPRLREYFPETLLWQPNLETDKQGRTQLKFKLADNITTWKLSLIGSTADGQIGTMEKDIRAFQPFFAELDPPKVLTEGDEISLPVVLRNYLDKTQNVDLQFKPESWFTLLSPARKRTEVKPNDFAKEIFGFRAIASIQEGKQRVTAIGSSASDAIEKAVHVHPDGEELANTVANVFGETGTLEINVPADAIKGSVHAELKVYPNLIAHVTEGIEGILKRPYGCGEQTISSTYPNVMALRLLKNTGQDEVPGTAAIAAKARKYARVGYERLLGYRDVSGGFTYWGKGEPDFALTAYALRFLHDASEVIEVNDDIIDEAKAWLLKEQMADGRWAVRNYYDKQENVRQTVMQTALLARALTSGSVLSKEEQKALQKAFDYLAPKLAEVDEPYAIALYTIAAQQFGDESRAKWGVERLRATSKEEAGGIYWALETNTPFYGWGLAGRIETTALALKALNQTTERTEGTEKNEALQIKEENKPSAIVKSPSVSSVRSVVDSKELISKGVYWLLRNKDRYGVWLSPQATVNVLDAFVALAANDKTAGETKAEVFVNGQRTSTITLPPSNQLSNPLVVDLTQQLATGNNRIEIKRPANVALATAQLVETHYLPWAKSLATQGENFKSGVSRALRLAVNFDKTEAQIGENITCKIEAERVAFNGYGMLLAEIGLPPGAEVDRASLELAVKGAGYDINHYDVLPDRVVFYLWPRAGGCKFSFQFRSRFGTKAQSSASILYDYYNPEARAVVAPTRFVVR